jgi:hypothetical protein
MTDEELNLAIMTKLGLAPIESWKTSYHDGVTTSECTYKASPTDYCNNWNDLMPLVVEYRVMDIFLFTKTETSMQDDLQRALAECLLKVLEAQK